MTQPNEPGTPPALAQVNTDPASPAETAPKKRAPRKAPAKRAPAKAKAGAEPKSQTAAVAQKGDPAPETAEKAPAASAPKKATPARQAKRTTSSRAVKPKAPAELPAEEKQKAEQAPKEAAEATKSDASPEATPAKRTRRGRRAKRPSTAEAAKTETTKAETAGTETAHPDAAPREAVASETDAPAKAPAPQKAPDPIAVEKTAAEQLAPAQREEQKKKPAGKASGNAKKTAAPKAAARKATPAKAAEKADPEPQKAPKAGTQPKRRMFMSVLPGEQVEVVLAENGRVTEYYVEMSHQAKTKNNIYKGVINNVDANLQAAFVSYGAEKNGFLQIDEVHPEYYNAPHDATRGKKYPPIQKVLKAGQEVLVQVVKEPTGSKGAFLTTYLSLAGRFLVLTPGKEQTGVSRKVEDEEERARLREMLNGINPGPGLGMIVRTVSAGTSKTTIQRDLQFLKRLWKDVRKHGMEAKAPAMIHQEPSLARRAVRDYLSDDIQELWVDDPETAEHILEYANLLFPRKTGLVSVHKDPSQSLWDRFGLTSQLEQIYSREVVLPSGGRIVFDQTEALMAIDINSGKISGKTNFESMALRTNMEAAEAIALHLKLRDIGGQIVIDFIEMRDSSHVRDVEKTMRSAMKNDRARHDVGRISRFGLMEVVRQRTALSALSISTEPCPHCHGLGTRRNMEWQAQQALRALRRQLRSAKPDQQAEVHVFSAQPELAMYLLNHKRERLLELEQAHGIRIEVRSVEK